MHDQRLRALAAWWTRSPTTSASLVPQDAVYDRSQASHAVNLFDMSEKYADVAPTAEVLRKLQAIENRTAG